MEWGPGKTPGSGWGLTLVGIAIAYAGLLGAATVITGGRGAWYAARRAAGSARSWPTP